MTNEKHVIDPENLKFRLGWRYIVGLVSLVVSVAGAVYAGFHSLKSDIYSLRSDIKDIRLDIRDIKKDISGVHSELTDIKKIIGKEQVLRKMEYRDRFEKAYSPYKDSVLYYDFIQDTLYFKAKRK